MFNPNSFENSAPDGVGVLEIAGEEKNGKLNRFIPLKRTIIGGTVGGPLAAMTITHTYGYAQSQCDKVLEAVYRFPLPGDAAVTGVLVAFGEVEIRAELKERKQAEEDYAEAKRQGRQAALVTRESPDVFTLSVAGIKPDEDVTVETSYVQLAKADGSGWTLRVPLTTAPRYVRADEEGSRHAHGQPLFSLRDPGHAFSLDILFAETRTIESPTHSLAFADEDGRTRVRLREGTVIPDRDFVLCWVARQEQERATLSVLTYEDAAAEYLYFLAQVAPPARPKPEEFVAREIILLVDHSGSMEGDKWKATDQAVKSFLSTLTPQDTFALGLFHNHCIWLSPQAEWATPAAVKKAVKFLDTNHESGGTELGLALEQALGRRHSDGRRSRHVLVITDAQVSDEGRILHLCEAEARRADRRRISVICIDAAPNAYLTLEMARLGGGVAKFLSHNAMDRDITSSLTELLAEWRQPVETGLRLEISRPSVEASGHQTIAATRSGWSAIDVGDLPAGRATWVAGRVKREGGDSLQFRAVGIGDRVIAGEGDASISAFANPGIKALFGAERVLGLEFLLASGRDVDETLLRLGYGSLAALSRRGRRSVYRENQTNDQKEVLSSLLLSESLEYGLLASVTGFVATRTEAGKVIEGTVPVANALPAGWSDDFAAPHMMAGGAGGGVAYRAMLSTPPPMLRAFETSMPRFQPACAGEDDVLQACQPSDDEQFRYDIRMLRQQFEVVLERGNIEQLRPDFQIFKAQYASLDREIESLDGQIGAAPPDLTGPRERINHLMNTIERLSHETERELYDLRRVDRMRQEVEDRSDPLAPSTSATAEQRAQIGKLQQEMKSMSVELRRLIGELEGMVNQLGPILHDLDLLNRPTTPLRLFAGTPEFRDGHAVLFDDRPPVGVYTWLEVRRSETLPELQAGNVKITLALSVPSTRSKKVSLSDVMAAGGRYPVVLVARERAKIALVLDDPDGDWSNGAPEIELWLT